MASQAQIKARENLMNIKRKREEEEEEYSSRFSYSEKEDPMTVARRNLETIKGKPIGSNASRLDALRKSAEERRIRQEALNKYKRIVGTDNAEEVKRIGSVGQALDERIQRSMGVKGDRIGSERLERAVALDRMKKSTAEKDALEKDTQYYKRLLTDDSQMDANTRRQALEKLKRTIMTEQITGDSKTLSDLSKSFSNATGKKVSQTDAYQMLENAQGQIDRDKYDQKMGEKRKELEKVLDEKGFETAAKKGRQIAQKKSVYNADMLAGYQNEDKSYPDIFKSQTEYEQYQDMTDTEKDVFDYYLATEGVQKAKEYLNAIKRDITKRQTATDTERLKEYATEHPGLSSTSSVAAGFATGMGALETMRQNAANVLTGEHAPVDINSKAFRATNAQDTIRNTVMENFQGSEDVKALKRFLYQTGMSMADFGTQAAAGALVGGFAGEAASLAGASAERAAQITATIANNASLPIMGAGAMSQTVKEVIENGGTNDQAMQLGLIAGAAEMVTERLGIDNLSKLSSQGVNSVKRAVHKIIAEGAIPEGLEEVVSDIVNNVANDAIMQENSDFNQAVERYMTPNAMTGEHISRRQAEDLAMKDRIKDMALSFAGGALSGGIMAAGAYGSGYIEGGKTGRALNEYYGISDETLINDAKALEGTNAKELAEYYEGKGKLTDRKKAELYNQILKDTKGEYTPSPEITQNETEDAQTGEEIAQTGEGIAQEARPVELTAEDLQEPQIDAQAKEKKTVQENVRQREKEPETGTQRSAEGVNYKGLQGDIKGIDRVENGKIYARVNTGDATIVQLVSNLNFDNAVTQALYQTAEGYDDAGARSFVKDYEGENLITYKRGFDAYYNAARAGMNWETAKNTNNIYGDIISDHQKIAAFNAGIADAENSFEKRFKKLKEDRSLKTRGSQIIENEAFRGLSKEAQDLFKSYAKISGANIVVDESIHAGNGRYANGYYDNNGTLHIAADSTNPFSVVTNHELTHYLKQYTPIYDEYKNYVMEYLMKKDSVSTGELIEKHISEYENAGRQISREEAMDEIVANASELFLTDESAVQQLVKENKSIGEKILDFFKEFISNLKEMLTGYEPKSKEAQMLNESLEAAQKAEKIWLEAMQDARRAGQKTPANSVTGGEIKKSFSLKEDVEETKDLIAVHNITEDKLNKQLELEGFPMISIAVTKTDIGHSDFGDISVVFTKDTIDPANKKNKVYSADAWTPTFPRIEYEANYEAARKAQDRINGIADKMNPEIGRKVKSFAAGLEYNLDNYGGYEGTVQKALRDNNMKAAYLTDKGESVDVEYKETRTEMKEIDREISQKLIDVFGNDIDNIAKEKKSEMVSKYGDQIRKALLDYYLEQGINEETAKSVVDATTGFEIASQVRKARNFKENGGIEVKREEDWTGTNKKINDRINKSDYEKWVRDIFAGIEEKSGLWNGKDPFTRTGNRRSFDSTHYVYNAENIVKAMIAQSGDVKNTIGFLGIKTVRAAAADEFRNIDDIKRSRSRLQSTDAEGYRKELDALESRLASTMEEVAGKEKDLFNHADAMNRIGETILDASKNPTQGNVKKVFEKNGWEITDAQAKEFSNIIKGVKEMPVDMFEAKPQRVIGYNEVAYWVVPDSISETTRKNIKRVSENAQILEYEKGNENQRKEVLNDLKDVKFQMREEDDGNLRYQMEDASEVDYETLKEENKELRSINKNLQDMIALEYGAEPQQDAIRKVSKHILKEYESEYDAKTLEKNLTAIWKYLANNQNPNGEELAAVTSRVAKGILEKSKHLDTEMRDQYKDMLKGIRSTKLKLDEQYRGDLDQVGGYSDFRKKNFGKIRLSNEGIEVDSYYQELASQYPELFDAEKYTTPADQLMNIADVVQMLQPTYINPYGMNMDQAAADLAYKIYDSYYNIAKKGNALETKKIAELNRARSQFKERQGKIREEMQQRYEERLKALKAENETLKRGESEKLLEQKAKYDSMIRRRAQLREESGERTQLLKALNRINRMRSTPENMKKAQELIGNIDLAAKSMTAQGQYNLELLRDRYLQELKNNPDFTESKSIEERIKRLDKERISDLGIGGVRDLLEAVLEFEHKVKTDAKQIDSEWKKTNYDLARKIEDEVKGSKGYNPNNPASNFTNMYNTSILSAEREFRKIAGYAKNSQMEQQAKELNKGQLKKTKFQQDAAEYFRPFIEKEGKWIDTVTGEKAKLVKIGEKNGKDIMVTPAMRMSLYLHAKAEANLRHIIGGTNIVKGQLNQYQGGGITVPDMKLYQKGKVSDAYARGETIKLTKTGLQKILSEMTPKEKRFAEMVSGFFNGQMKEAINDTSLKLDGFEKARVTNYFPIRTNKNFTNTDFDTLVKDATIEGMGILKQRSGGTNPVMLEDIFSVLNRQIDSVSSYYGLAIPIRNFNKIYNSTASEYESSVKSAIAEKWGTRGQKYIENLLSDLQGGRKSEMNWLDRMRGRYAQAVLTLNPSVTMKQAASYPTAAATLGWGPITKALVNQTVRTDRALIDKYSPLLWYRNQGNVTNDIADINQAKTWATKAPKPIQKYLLNWIQNTDTLTVQRLWLASEYYVQDEMKVKKGTEGYYEKVAEVYNRVIEDTQPNYTVMQRPDILRSTNQMTKALTMFSTQRLQNYGIVYDAIGEYRARLADMKKGTGTKEDVRAAGKNLARAFSSQIVAAAVLAGMTFIAGAALHREKNWEDEAGNITTESFMKQFGKDFGATIAGSSIGGSELYEFLTAMTGQEKWWGFETSSVATINDFGDDLKTTYDALKNLLTGDGSYQAVADAIKAMGVDASKFFGVPVENTKKIIDGAILWKADAKAGTFLKASDQHYPEYKKLWEYEKAGKTKEYTALLKELQDELGETAVKKGLQQRQISELGYEEEMKTLIDAREKNDLKSYKESMKKLEDAGYTKETIMKFLNSKQKVKEITYDELWDVWQNGTKEQYEDMKKKLMMQGKTEDSIKNEMKKRQTANLKAIDPDFQKAADAADAGNKALYESIRDSLAAKYESQGYTKTRIASAIKSLRKTTDTEEDTKKDDEVDVF